MSHLRRYNAPDAALAALALGASDADPPWVRVQTTEGTLREGRALALNADGLTLSAEGLLPMQRIAYDTIQRLEVRVLNRRREWTFALVAAAAVVAILVGAANTPILERVDDSSVFMLIYAAAAGAAPFVLARTPLGRWLHRWHVTYAASDR